MASDERSQVGVASVGSAPAQTVPDTLLSRLSSALAQPKTRSLLQALMFAAPAMLIFAMFTYVPFFRAIYLSLHVTNPFGEAVRWNGLQYYERILGFDGRTEGLESIRMSLTFALMVVPTGIVCALGLALLATAKVRFIGLFRTIFTISIAISLASSGVIWSLIYNPASRATTWLVELLQIGTPSLLGSDLTALPAVAVMTVWSGLGFNFIIMLAGLQAIPQDLYESASIDGANRFQALRYITLPLLSPTLLFLLIVTTIGSLQAFTQFHLLIPQRNPNVFVYATYRSFWYDNRYGFASAMSIVLFVMLFTLTLIQYRVVNRGVHYQ